MTIPPTPSSFSGGATHRGLAFLALVLLLSCPAFAQLGDIRPAHDPRIIQAGQFFYCFSTGIGIPIRQSSDLITWRRVGTVFSSPPAWIAKEFTTRYFWAPDISYFANTYHLYFAVSRFGKNDSRIGLETNPTLDPTDPKYHWTDQGKVMETYPGDNWNAIDPAVAFDRDNNPWLAMGSFWDGIKMRRLNPDTGFPSTKDPTLYSLARRPKPGAIEAAYICHHGDYFYLFVSFDYCCRGIRSNYKIMVGRSTEITGPYADTAGIPMPDGGGSLVLATQQNIIGPGHCGILHARNQDWLVNHFYDAFNYGRPTLQIRPIIWTTDQWPKPGPPIATPTPPTRPSTRPSTRGWDF
jgi:arabinan endo-1,5-alpha-L-arabinosidase